MARKRAQVPEAVAQPTTPPETKPEGGAGSSTAAVIESVEGSDEFKKLAEKMRVVPPQGFATGGYVVDTKRFPVVGDIPIYQGDNLATVHATRVAEIEKYLMIYANGHVGWSYSDAFGTVLAYGLEDGTMTWMAER